MKLEALTHLSKRQKHPPRISFREMCDEFNVTSGVLVSALRDKDSPKPLFKTANMTLVNTWYNASEVRKWWKNRQ